MPFRTNIRARWDKASSKANEANLLQWVNKRHEDLFKDCMQRFIKAAVGAMGQDVDTGMSMASLIPLALEVDFDAFMIRATAKNWQKTEANKKRYIGAGRFAGPKYKSIEAGVLLGRKAYSIDFTTPETKGRSQLGFNFGFDISVHQFYYQETGIPDSDVTLHQWESLQKGKVAFLKRWESRKEKVLGRVDHVMARFLKDGVLP